MIKANNKYHGVTHVMNEGGPRRNNDSYSIIEEKCSAQLYEIDV